MPEENASKKTITPVVEEIVTDPPVQPETQQPAPPEVTQTEVQPTPNPAMQPPPAPLDQQKKGFHLNIGFVLVVIVVAVIVALVSGALYVYFNGVNDLKGQAQPTPLATVEPTVAPVATPLASSTPGALVKLDSYKVSVLNGSGRIGEAGKVKDLLEKAGFKVTSTGNADNFSFKNTLIQAKTNVSADAVSKAKEALTGSYSVEIGETLNDKSSFDVIVTVGAK